MIDGPTFVLLMSIIGVAAVAFLTKLSNDIKKQKTHKHTTH